MREIKFRVWNGYSMYSPTIAGIYDISVFLSEIENLMQYTGLKDKNGVEIYEGDIIQTTDKKENEKNSWIGVVEDNNFGWLALKYKEYLNPSWLGALSAPINEPQTATWINSTCEIIGNIYENKELLENIK